MIKYLTLEEVLEMHDVLIEKFGGLSGIRDLNLLLSAIETPKAAMFGKDLYPTVYDKAAAYLFHIVQNHPFNDANKRTGFVATCLFLNANRVRVALSDEAFEHLVIEVAKGKVDKEAIAHLLEHGK